jgi:hypothetical protein
MKTLLLTISILLGGCVSVSTEMDRFCLEECQKRYDGVISAMWHGTDPYWNVERCMCFFKHTEKGILVDL